MKTTAETVTQDVRPTADETLKVRINRVRVSTKIKGGPPGDGICCGRMTHVSE